MKKIILTALLTMSFSAQAMNLTCVSVGEACNLTEGGSMLGSASDHWLIQGTMDIRCYVTSKDKAYDQPILVSIFGFGPGLRFDKGNALNIFCPTMKKKSTLERLKDDNIHLFGAEADASAVVGAKVGAFANTSGDSCFITGVNVGVGASVMLAAEMTFVSPKNQGTYQQQCMQ